MKRLKRLTFVVAVLAYCIGFWWALWNYPVYAFAAVGGLCVVAAFAVTVHWIAGRVKR